MPRYRKGSTPKLNQILIDELSLLIRRGAYIESAAAACGISKDTFYRWLKKGKRDESNTLEKQLSDTIMKALAEAEMRDLEVIDKAALGTPDRLDTDEHGNLRLDYKGLPIVIEYGLQPNWKASAWRLERRFPERWGNKTKTKANLEPSSIEVVFVDHNES